MGPQLPDTTTGNSPIASTREFAGRLNPRSPRRCQRAPHSEAVSTPRSALAGRLAPPRPGTQMSRAVHNFHISKTTNADPIVKMTGLILEKYTENPHDAAAWIADNRESVDAWLAEARAAA